MRSYKIKNKNIIGRIQLSLFQNGTWPRGGAGVLYEGGLGDVSRYSGMIPFKGFICIMAEVIGSGRTSSTGLSPILLGETGLGRVLIGGCAEAEVPLQ